MFDDRSIREALQGTFGVVTTADGVIIHLWFLEITFGSSSISVKKKGATSNIFEFNYNSTKVAKATTADTATMAVNAKGQANSSTSTSYSCFKVATTTTSSGGANTYICTTMLISDEIQGGSQHATYLATFATRGDTITGHIKLIDSCNMSTNNYLDIGIVKTGTNYNTEWYLFSPSGSTYRKINTVLLASDHISGNNRFSITTPVPTATVPTFDQTITHT